MSPRTGFTLMELLVVISIIGMLSTIVLSQLSSARTKARIAAGKEFAANVYHEAGDQIVGQWDFDECSGTTVKDSSGYGNNGTLIGSPTWSNNTPSGSGCSLSFNTITSYIDIPNSSTLSLANNFTVSLWVYITTASANIFMLKGDDAICGVAPAYGFNSNGFMLIANDCNNAPYDSKHGDDAGNWHQLVGVVASGNTRTFYLDGHLVGSATSAGNSWNNTDDLFIGRGASYSANALIDEVRVYAKTLTAFDVQTLYAEESIKHRLAMTK